MRDLSRATVTAAPAQFSSWNEARSELMIEKKKPLKAQLAGELAAAADDAERTSIRVRSFPASLPLAMPHILTVLHCCR